MNSVVSFFAQSTALIGLWGLLIFFSPTYATPFEEDGRNTDVQVLQAWKSKPIVESALAFAFSDALSLDLANCALLTQTSLDCSNAILTLLSAPLTRPAVYSVRREGDGSLHSENGQCLLIEIRTVIKKTAFEAASFSGIGFFSAASPAFGQTNSITMIPKSQLHLVGEARLKEDGQKAWIHRFIAVDFCSGQGGNTGTLLKQEFQFLPFVQYETNSPETGHSIYRRWEDVPLNHRLNQDLSGFDHEKDLILPRTAH